MNKQIAKLIPLLARGVLPSAAVASGLLSPLALGAPGDLDPFFGNVGRLGPIVDLNGPAWSLEALDSDGILLAGGDAEFLCDSDEFYHCAYYGYDGLEATNFVTSVSGAGSIDLTFHEATLAHIQVFDVVLQPDGKVVAVGRRVSRTSTTDQQLVVFRLERGGPLDGTFGNGGIVELGSAGTAMVRHIGTSVVLDPDGRIVIAGSRDNDLIVLRLLADGSFDNSFGTSGIFVGIGITPSSATHVMSTAGGGYRVSHSGEYSGCEIVALTSGGTLDNTFGTSGIVPFETPLGVSVACNATVMQPDGRLLVAGNSLGQGFATRLLTSGQSDPSFAANAVSAAMEDATALALGDGGSIFVAGSGVNGASIMRLQAIGYLDVLFGYGGSTQIDLPSEFGTYPLVHDLIVRPDGGVVAAGGSSNLPFVIRLLGAGGGDVPGILGFTQQFSVSTTEGTQEVVVNVRRTGGDSGSVSVAYQTAAEVWLPATGGQDFVEIAGRLTWDDGDRTERAIHVSVLADDSPEEYEQFRVMLSDAQGGAGLGTRNATVIIGPDGGPFGQFSFELQPFGATESASAQVYVFRNYYSTGAVSVTLTLIGGTATAGDDFAPEPVMVSWADGESDPKVVQIPIRNDTTQEGKEVFTVELSNPTGGAVIGPRSSATVTIAASDQPPPPPPPPPKPSSGGGGGAFGYLSLLLLGLITFLRSARMTVRSLLAPLSR